jgi:hypothetical protein
VKDAERAAKKAEADAKKLAGDPSGVSRTGSPRLEFDHVVITETRAQGF